jgi:hypothetical protein
VSSWFGASGADACQPRPPAGLRHSRGNKTDAAAVFTRYRHGSEGMAFRRVSDVDDVRKI